MYSPHSPPPARPPLQMHPPTMTRSMTRSMTPQIATPLAHSQMPQQRPPSSDPHLLLPPPPHSPANPPRQMLPHSHSTREPDEIRPPRTRRSRGHRAPTPFCSCPRRRIRPRIRPGRCCRIRTRHGNRTRYSAPPPPPPPPPPAPPHQPPPPPPPAR